MVLNFCNLIIPKIQCSALKELLYIFNTCMETQSE